MPNDIIYRFVKVPGAPGHEYFVEYSMPSYSEPVLVTNYWPISLDRSRVSADDVGLELLTTQADGIFRFKGTDALGRPLPEVWRMREKSIVLPNGGRTECIPSMTKREPIPCPKQRGKKLPTKYEYGAWKKQTAKGWVLA